jgi:queuine/archaeosine tRNA-ribosyltransferase
VVLYAASPIAEIITAAERDIKYKNYDLTWWGNNSLFNTPGILLSHGKHKDANVRQGMKIPLEYTIIGDSGGFQIMSYRAKGKELKIDPLEVLKWQEANCNIGMTLDISPFNLQPIPGGKSVATRPVFVGDEEFKKRIDQTCRNNEIFEANRTPNKMKIYNVIHYGTDNVKQMTGWLDAMNTFKFDGYAAAIKPPNDPVRLAVNVGLLYDRGVRENVHVLGISGFKVLPVLAYLGKFIKNLSTDSFSYGIFAIVREMISLSGPFLSYRPAQRVHTQKFCSCPVCSRVEVDDLYRTDVPGYSIMALHNLWKYLEFTQYLETLVQDPEAWRVYISKKPNVKKAIDFIDNTVQYGWEDAITKANLKQSTLEAW